MCHVCEVNTCSFVLLSARSLLWIITLRCGTDIFVSNIVTLLRVQVKDTMQAAPAAAPAADGAAPAFDIAEIKRQGLTLVHFPAQPKHFSWEMLVACTVHFPAQPKRFSWDVFVAYNVLFSAQPKHFSWDVFVAYTVHVSAQPEHFHGIC
jgi:hypothetical protein